MSSESPDDGAQVLDEEDRISNRLKDRILDARDRVADREDAIFVEAPLDDDVSITGEQATQIWATSVRQYLRVIEPLLRSDEIQDSHYYYRNLPLIDKTITPPDGPTRIIDGDDVNQETIMWSKFYSDAYDTNREIMDNPLYGPGFSPPEPRQITLSGLKSVIETDGITETWHVPLNPQMWDQRQRVAKPTYKQPLDKQMLEYAVRKADQFLQDAGVGLDVGDPSREAHGDYSDVIDTDRDFAERED